MEERNHKSRDAPPSPQDNHTPPLPPAPSVSQSSDRTPSEIKDAIEPVDAAQAGELSLHTAFQQLKLADKEPPKLPVKSPMRMFSAIGAVFQQATTQDTSIHLDVDDWRARFEHAEIMSEQGQKDVGALTLVRTMLDQLWSHSNEDALVHVATLLADGSRERESKIETGSSSPPPCVYPLIAYQRNGEVPLANLAY